MTTETGITSILGVEKQLNKSIAGGYASLDATGDVPLSELSNATAYTDTQISSVNTQISNINTQLGQLSVISNVYVESSIPFLDDTSSFYNLIYIPTGKYISFDDTAERFYYS